MKDTNNCSLTKEDLNEYLAELKAHKAGKCYKQEHPDVKTNTMADLLNNGSEPEKMWKKVDKWVGNHYEVYKQNGRYTFHGFISDPILLREKNKITIGYHIVSGAFSYPDHERKVYKSSLKDGYYKLLYCGEFNATHYAHIDGVVFPVLYGEELLFCANLYGKDE